MLKSSIKNHKASNYFLNAKSLPHNCIFLLPTITLLQRISVFPVRYRKWINLKRRKIRGSAERETKEGRREGRRKIGRKRGGRGRKKTRQGRKRDGREERKRDKKTRMRTKRREKEKWEGKDI